MSPIIRNFIAKGLFKKSGVIANNKSVEFSANALEQRLKNLGVDPNTIKSEGELNQILSYVKQAEDQAFNQQFGNVLSRNKFQKKAEVVDLKNKKLDTEKPILGGTQETDEQILQRLKIKNKEAIERLKNKKDPPEELAGGGVAGLLGERTGYANGNGVADEDAEKATLGKRVRQLMDEGYDFGEAVKEAMKEGYADGGPARQNFKMGKRAFLKLLAGTGAGIAGLKSGLLGFGGKQATKKAVTETVKQTAGSGSPPPYFINLVKKIKNLGDDVTETSAIADRQKVTKFKDYEMTEDISTGNIEILKKERGGFREDVYMSYKVDDVPLRGKKKSTKVEEYEEYTARPDQDGKMRDVEPGVPDEVVQEGTVFEDTLSEFGKADGGRIGYSAGSKVIGKGIMAGINKLFGKGTMTTADKIKRPQQALDREMFKKFETNYPETGAADATLNIPVQQEGKFTKAEYLIQRLENTIKQNPKDKYVKETFPNFIKELKDNPELAKNENVFKELGGDLPEGQQIVVYGDDSIDFFTQKSGPGNIDRLKKIMSKYNISKDKALKIMKMEPNDQVMEFKMLEIANRKLNATGGLAAMLGE